jgi:glycosyltransferase involved in cell wall biosynthesis
LSWFPEEYGFIIVDDGSVDGSLRRLEGFLEGVV